MPMRISGKPIAATSHRAMPQVTGQRKLEAAAHAQPIDRRDDPFLDRRDQVG
jgi:hypothetical protein